MMCLCNIDGTYKVPVSYSHTYSYIISWPQIETYVKMSPGSPLQTSTGEIAIRYALKHIIKYIIPAKNE